MNKIMLLPEAEIRKIAAGEVIERPVNIVKELLENALDAGSTQISLYIEEGGKKLIRIVDNGCGMTIDDARMCVLPHATSKIHSFDELINNSYFGFRGEALASIAATSNLCIKTRSRAAQDAHGIMLNYAHGKLIQEEIIACQPGTDIAAANLFEHLPVRQKFLKRDEVEWNQIQLLVQAFCLSNHTLHIKLYHDEKMIFNLPPATDVTMRVAQLWEHQTAQKLMPLNILETKKPDWLAVTGFISEPHVWRYHRNHLFFFLNNRWIKDRDLTKAVMNGYGGVLPPERFPFVALFITIDPTMVDINVHPKKEEVRFCHPGMVTTYVRELIRTTLEHGVTKKITSLNPNSVPAMPSHIMHEVPSRQMPRNQLPEPFVVKRNQADIASQQLLEPLLAFQFSAKNSAKEPFAMPTPSQELQTTVMEQITAPQENVPSYTIIGQLFQTYLILEGQNELVIIDQHAVHERILYEKFVKNFEKKEAIQLMFPHIMSVNKQQLTLLLEEQSFFADQGIIFEQCGKERIAIKTSAAGFQQCSLQELLLEAAEFIAANHHLDKELFRKKLNEHVHGQLACKNAIKAGDILSMEQANALVEEWRKTPNRFICVHGRPTMWTMSRHELDKLFRRK